MASRASVAGETAGVAGSILGDLAWRSSVLGAAVFLLVAASLAVSGFSHVDQRPLANTAALAVAALAAGLAALVRWPLLRGLPRREMSISRAIVLIAPSLALLLLLDFLSVLVSVPLLVLLGSVFAVVEIWLLYSALSGKTATMTTAAMTTAAEPSETALLETRPRETHTLETVVFEENTTADDALAEESTGWQQLSRTRNSQGGEYMTGRIVLELAPGERSRFTHVAFCPAWPKTPAIEAECVDGWPADVRIDQVEPHGVRFEIRLSPPPTEPSETVFVFTAGAAETCE